jgi:hypothetical protein
VTRVSEEEHAYVRENERKRKELQDLQGAPISEKHKSEWKALNQKATQSKKDKEAEGKTSKARPPRNVRVASLEEMPGTFAIQKRVMDMQYCVANLGDLRALVGRNNLSKFSDFWAPDYKNTTPLKPVFTPEKLIGGNDPLLAQFYDGGRITTKNEPDPINPPYFRISRELMGRMLHTLRQEYISDDEHGRLSENFMERVKDVLAPLETTLADSAKRLEEHHAASMEQHEKLVKNTHDFLAEASEQYKTALTKQVRVMEEYNVRHEALKESTETMANAARNEFRDILNVTLTDQAPTEGTKTRRIWAETLLASAENELTLARKGWDVERAELREKIELLEKETKEHKAERDKYKDLVSAHAVRSFQRSQEQVEEKAKAAKLAKEHEELRRLAEHNEGQLKGAQRERDAAVLENQDLKRKREASNSPPPSPLRILSRPLMAAPVQDSQPAPTRGESPQAKQPAPKKSRNRKERWANAPAANVGAPTTSINVGGNDGRDPVLHSALTSFENKADIIKQIDTSADYLNLGSKRYRLRVYC